MHELKYESSHTHFNEATRYIRVHSPEGARFVEFDFAIGDPTLFVELIMPPAVFETFCRANNVIEMTEAQKQTVDAETAKWRYGEDTLMADNHSRTH
jgi:phenol hydroxylase P0 protein